MSSISATGNALGRPPLLPSPLLPLSSIPSIFSNVSGLTPVRLRNCSSFRCDIPFIPYYETISTKKLKAFSSLSR